MKRALTQEIIGVRASKPLVACCISGLVLLLLLSLHVSDLTSRLSDLEDRYEYPRVVASEYASAALTEAMRAIKQVRAECVPAQLPDWPRGERVPEVP